MAYSSTIDERYAGGYLQYSAGDLDASNLLNGVFVIAESSVYNSTAYGLLADYYTTADIDVYSLGVLNTGYYTIDVDNYTWDYTSYDYSYISKFQIVDSAGYIVDTSYSSYTDINLTVTSSQTYYLKITGPSYGGAQYSAQYTKTGELTTIVNYPAISEFYVDGNAIVGETLGVAGNYYDSNGIPGSGLISSIMWYRTSSDGVYYADIVNETGVTYTLTNEDEGFYIGYSYAFIDSDGFPEIFNPVWTSQLIEAIDANSTPTLTNFTMSDHAAMALVNEGAYYEHNTSLHFADVDGLVSMLQQVFLVVHH